MRSSHMYVGQEVQAGTIRRQTTAQPAIPLDGQTHSAAALRASISLSPFAPPSRPLHAASESHVGHQISALGVLSCSEVPNSSRWVLPCRVHVLRAIDPRGGSTSRQRVRATAGGISLYQLPVCGRRSSSLTPLSTRRHLSTCHALDTATARVRVKLALKAMVVADTRSEVRDRESDCQASSRATGAH